MEISLAAEKIGHILSLPITNSILLSWVASILIIVIAAVCTRKIALQPNGKQNFIEWVIEYLYNTVNDVIGDRKETKKYFPLLATIFIFVISNNWLGLIPGVGTIGFHEFHEGKEVFVPLLRSGNADLNMTLALALIAVTAIQIFGSTARGFFKYSKKFFDLSGIIPFFIGILELLSEFSKIISFSFRLFGNVFAGEVLLMVVAFIVPYMAPLPFFGLEIFVGFVQALVFTMLTLVFIKTATQAH